MACLYRRGIPLIAIAVAVAAVACSGGGSSPATVTTDAGASGGTTGTGGNNGAGGSSAAGGTGATAGTSGSGGAGACSQTLCGGKCVDTQTDNANCGACGTACTQGTTCQAGACKPVPGSFGAPCTKNGDCNSQLCLQNGHCSKKCSGASDCPPAPEWSCAPLPGYPSMCQCTPSSSSERCDGQDDNCDGLVDNGATCSQTGYTCQNGSCKCDPANLCGGTCVDKQTDVNNCGACGKKCATTGQTCQAGTCTCPNGGIVCSGACVPSDSSNCGSCGHTCSAPTSACVAGQCACPNGGVVCNGACVPSDSSNCGACGHTCGAGQVCAGSACGSEWADWPMPNPPSTGLPNPAKYDTSTPGVVVDKVTGLMWQRAVDANSYTWADAKAYCASLSLAGHSDWRLPTEIELFSLVDYTRANPAIDTTAFPNTPATGFWSSSPLAGDPSGAWLVDFYSGGAGSDSATNTNRVRCVR